MTKCEFECNQGFKDSLILGRIVLGTRYLRASAQYTYIMACTGSTTLLLYYNISR